MFGSLSSPSTTNFNPNNDHVVQNSPSDGVSSLSWSPTANVLVAGSWDNKVSCWQVHSQGVSLQAEAKVQFAHEAPVLCTAFSADGSTVFSGSADKTAKMWQLNNPSDAGTQIAAHDAAISCIDFIPELNMVVTGSWDKKLKFWDLRTPNPAGTFELPERCYAMDVRHPLMVVATAERRIVVYDLTGQPKEYKQLESPLKYQSRCISVFPDKSGFALGSIEGRVAIHHVDPANAAKNFAFKCHRETEGSNTMIYSVNSIAFHKFGTFATAGSDGVYNFWDKDSKQRLKAFTKCPQTISCSKFSTGGEIYAYALSYDWSRGAQGNDPQAPNAILLHYTNDDEIKQRKKK